MLYKLPYMLSKFNVANNRMSGIVDVITLSQDLFDISGNQFGPLQCDVVRKQWEWKKNEKVFRISFEQLKIYHDNNGE